jgi:hypothetical protein
MTKGRPSSRHPANGARPPAGQYPGGPPGPARHSGRARAKDPQAEADCYLKDHLVSIHAIEQQIGVDLLPQLDADALKQAVASELRGSA